MSYTVAIGDIVNAVSGLAQDAATTIPKLMDPEFTMTPMEALGVVDMTNSAVGLSAGIVKGLADAFSMSTLSGITGAIAITSNAATVSSGFAKMTDAFAKNNSEQFAEGMLDLIGGGAGMLGTFPAYRPAAVLIQAAALAAKTHLKNNPGELNRALDKLSRWSDFFFPELSREINRHYTEGLNYSRRRDPLVLDLDGDGIEAVGINPARPILFDHDADAIQTATGWIAPDDALVVLDLNHNGTIDTGRELFGDNTLLPTGSPAAHGYQALAQHDTNADGQITSTDAVYSQLRLWRDLNQDGLSQSDELATLAASGIASIGVRATATTIDHRYGARQHPALSGNLKSPANTNYRREIL